jgi:prepilin-type processing-associated H-X9-DG protein
VSSAQTILVTETTNYTTLVDGVLAANTGQDRIEVGQQGSPADSWGSPIFGHFQMPNFLFADGHVKAMRIEATLSPVNMWNTDNKAAMPSTTRGYKNLMNAKKRLEALQ